MQPDTNNAHGAFSATGEAFVDFCETIAALRNPEVREILAAANQTMADQLKEETEKLLDSVLYTRSMEMKNGFHMSDF